MKHSVIFVLDIVYIVHYRMFDDFISNQNTKLIKNDDRLWVMNQQNNSTPGAKVLFHCIQNKVYTLLCTGRKKTKKQISQVHLWISGKQTGIISYKETSLTNKKTQYEIEFNSGHNRQVYIGFLFENCNISDTFTLHHFEIIEDESSELWDGEELSTDSEEQWPIKEYKQIKRNRYQYDNQIHNIELLIIANIQSKWIPFMDFITSETIILACTNESWFENEIELDMILTNMNINPKQILHIGLPFIISNMKNYPITVLLEDMNQPEDITSILQTHNITNVIYSTQNKQIKTLKRYNRRVTFRYVPLPIILADTQIKIYDIAISQQYSQKLVKLLRKSKKFRLTTDNDNGIGQSWFAINTHIRHILSKGTLAIGINNLTDDNYYFSIQSMNNKEIIHKIATELTNKKTLRAMIDKQNKIVETQYSYEHIYKSIKNILLI